MTDLTNLKQRLDLLAEMESDLGSAIKGRFWCPWCQPGGSAGGHHSPVLTLYKDGYKCFGCGKSGDVLTWLQEYRGLSWREIFELTETNRGDLQLRPRPAITQPLPEIPPVEDWQSRALVFVNDCESRLWLPEGERALDYLTKSRGLQPETVRRYRLGYNPHNIYESRSAWGLPDESESKRVWLPKGITIPSFVDGVLWYVNTRRPGGQPKYYKVPGSRAALFGADNLRGAELVLLTEGEFDCILADQELGDVAGVASLGSASNHLNLVAWGIYLLPALAILAALDVDQAGQRSTDDLMAMSRRIHPVRVPVLRSGDKDVSDYYMAGGDLWEWLKYNLDRLNLLGLLSSPKPVG